jgi:tetratricopeptide (TPR) repeat protein
MNQPDEATKLMQHGFRLLQEQNYRDAIAIGLKLKKLRHSSAFEILARSYREQGKLQKAISVLKEGTRVASGVWVLWKFLGDFSSDAGDFKAAEKAYQKALVCHPTNPALIHLNRAIAFEQACKVAKALEAATLVKSSELRRLADSIRVGLLLKTSRTAYAMRLASRLSRSDKPAKDPEIERRVWLACARVFSSQPRSFPKARNAITQVFELDFNNIHALSLLREMNAIRSDDARNFKLILHGKWNSKKGFFRTYFGVARDKESAFNFACELEVKSLRPSLLIDEIQFEKKKRPNDLEGIYGRGAYMLYPSKRKRGKAP